MTAILTPELAPSYCGVGDYSRRLALEWNPNSNWTFIVMKGGKASQCAWPEVRVEQALADHNSLKNILDKNSISTLIVQYAGFGYDVKGVPSWLPSVLRKWRKANPDNRLIIMIHEIWGKSMPWRLGFYRQPKQQRVLREIVDISDSVLTSTALHKRVLESKFGISVILAPVPSNIEPINPPWWETVSYSRMGKNRLRVVVFGHPNPRVQALRWHKNFLKELVKRDQLEVIAILGKGLTQGDFRSVEARLLQGIVPLERLRIVGEQPHDRISDELGSSQVLLSANSLEEFEKSGSIKAALAHGVVPVIRGKNRSDNVVPVEINDGTERLANDLVKRFSFEYLSMFGNTGRSWYKKNSSWKHTVKIYKRISLPSTTPPSPIRASAE